MNRLYRKAIKVVFYAAVAFGIMAYAKGGVVEAITFFAEMFPQQRIASFMPSTGCIPLNAREIAFYGAKVKGKDKPDEECNYRELARTFYELGFDDQALYAACRSGTAEELFGKDTDLCTGFDLSRSSEAVEAAERAKVERIAMAKSHFL